MLERKVTMDNNNNENIGENANNGENISEVNNSVENDFNSEPPATTGGTEDTFKNLDMKKEIEVTQGFFKNFFSDPLAHVKTASNSSQLFVMAIFLNIVWILASFVPILVMNIRLGNWAGSGLQRTWNVISTSISPAISVIVLALLILVFSKDSKKPLTTLIAAVTIARIPLIIASIIAIINVFTHEVVRVTSQVTALASALSVVLVFFAIKTIFAENNENKFFMTFAKIYAVYFLIRIGLSFLGLAYGSIGVTILPPAVNFFI